MKNKSSKVNEPVEIKVQMDTLPKAKKPRCAFSGCKKKLNMTCVSCSECSLRFCFQHMNRHSHNCCELINVRERKKEELKNANPKIQESKLEKI